MSPPTTILSLPNELVVAIAASGQHDRGTHKPVTTRSEWILSHLCHRFRHVIVAAPALWTNISISLSISWRKLQDRQQYEEILRLYLHRSIPLKVSVCLGIVIPSTDGVIELFTNWLHRVAPEMERVRSLSVDLGLHADDLGLAFAPLRHLAAPNLVHLDITNHNTNSLYRCPFELFSLGTPKLSCVRLDGFLPFPIPSWMSSSSITHLEVESGEKDLIGDDVAFLSSILMQPTALVHLRLDLTWDIQHTDPRIRILSLQSLSIHINESQGPMHLVFILDLFDCPALTELAIAGSHGDQIFALLELPGFPRSSFPVLRSLSFIYRYAYAEGCSCWEDTLISPVHRTEHPNNTPLFPALSSLSLVGQCSTARLVRKILGAQPLPWPPLKTLTVSPIKGIPDVSKALQDAVQRSPQRIPKLRLGRALFLSEKWRESGVDVEVVDLEELVKPFREFYTD
ncbi:F-box domain-containing protein [Favolaschia claudopus]|uniref:F-box domain-containing protein n=1 Tax=Favolaschia claudopus TaxID=2862362 RepID=A0AAW0EDI3_9AGAR